MADQFEQTEQYMETSFQNMEQSFSYMYKVLSKLFGLIMKPLEWIGNQLFPNGIDGELGSKEQGEEFF